MKTMTNRSQGAYSGSAIVIMEDFLIRSTHKLQRIGPNRHREGDVGELLRSGNREISVFRDLGLEENLSHKAHIEYGASVLSSCSSSPSWLKRSLHIRTGFAGSTGFGRISSRRDAKARRKNE